MRLEAAQKRRSPSTDERKASEVLGRKTVGSRCPRPWYRGEWRRPDCRHCVRIILERRPKPEPACSKAEKGKTEKAGKVELVCKDVKGKYKWEKK